MTVGTEMQGCAPGTVNLSKCNACGRVQFPPRPLCCDCLAEELIEVEVAAAGRLLTSTLIHYSLEPEQAETTPNAIGLVKLDAGPTVFVRLRDMPALNQRVIVHTECEQEGKHIFYASAAEENR